MMLSELMSQARKPFATSKATAKKTTATVVNKLTLDDGSDGDEKPNNAMALYQEQSIASDALSMLSEWFETTDDDLDEGEGYGDRLMSLMVAVADDNQDGELDEDEQEVVNVALNASFDYLVSKGVSEENAQALLEDFDNDVAQSIHQFVLGKLPDGEDALSEEMDNLVFSSEDNEAVLDSVANEIITDAAYRKVFAIRNGKKLRIKKRISGKVRLSAKQRMAIKKAQRKANTGAAKMRRLKSFKIRRRMGF